MYSKYNLEINDSFYNNEINKHLESGRKIFEKYGKMARDNLTKFIYGNGHIDGKSMKDSWFQMEDVNIFISHSHTDLTKVKAFAGWLYDTFKLKVFIDSCVWGYCDDLLLEIDNRYCKNKDKNSYNYKLRNYTTSHVHIMLSTALVEMIDRTECIMFYNTPNAVSLTDDLDKIRKEKNKVTMSPWIYYELAMTSLIRRKNPPREIKLNDQRLIHSSAYSEINNVNIEHSIDEYLEEMIQLNQGHLKMWAKNYSASSHNADTVNIPYADVEPLDVLYNLPY